MENKDIQLNSEVDIDSEGIEVVGIHTICRLCANQNERLIGVFSDEGISNDLANKINLYLPIKVSISDELPLQCCWNCASTLLAWHDLVLTSVETDRKFRNSQFITEKQIIGSVTYENTINATVSDDNEGSEQLIKYEDDGDHNSSDIDDKKIIELFDQPDSVIIKKKDTTCDICNKTMKLRDLKRHKMVHHSEITKLFDEVADLDTKTCTECNTTFDNRTSLRNHVKDIHNVTQKRHRRRNNEIVAQFFCDICEKGYTRKHDMEKHRNKSHSDQQATKDTDINKRKKNIEVLSKCKLRDDDGKVTYKCDYCDRVFAQSYNLMRHRTIHTGVRAFFCHICGKSFRISNGLSRHINEFHYGMKKFSCEICKKTFTARATKEEHMNIHTNNRPFVCDVCGKSFKQKASLHIHKMFHTNVFKFQCSTCGKKFRRAQDLKVHNWLHTGHRPYSCHKCTAAFRLRQDLKRHLKIHDRLNECVCSECGCTFSQERYLKIHKKIHKTNISINGD